MLRFWEWTDWDENSSSLRAQYLLVCVQLLCILYLTKSRILSLVQHFLVTLKQNESVENLINQIYDISAVISCANAALDCLITEVFPTNLRATGVAISMVAARLGGIIGNGNNEL